jgi:Rieske Fe-S protein
MAYEPDTEPGEPSPPIWRIISARTVPFPPAPERHGSPALRRRQLLRGGFWAGVGVVVAGGFASAIDFFNPHGVRTFGAILTVPSDHVPKPGAEPYHDRIGKFWLVNLNPDEGVPERFRSVAPPSRSGGLVAFYERCPHLGADVPWRPDFVFGGLTGWFRCPTHGATFTKGGVRVFGPAPRSLDTFPVLPASGGAVRVNSGRIGLGGIDDPQRTVPAGERP